MTTFVRAPVSWLQRNVLGVDIMVGNGKRRLLSRLSYRVTGVGIMGVIMSGDGKQRLPLRISYHASVNPPQRGSDTENITFRRFHTMERKVDRLGAGVHLVFIFLRRNCSCSPVSTDTVLSYYRAEAEEGQYCSFIFHQLHAQAVRAQQRYK